MLPWSDWGVSTSNTEGDESEALPRITASPPGFDILTTAAQESGAMGDKAKPLAAADGFAI